MVWVEDHLVHFPYRLDIRGILFFSLLFFNPACVLIPPHNVKSSMVRGDGTKTLAAVGCSKFMRPLEKVILYQKICQADS